MPGKYDITPQKNQRGMPSTPSTPQPGQKILTGLSMGQKYHDDPSTLEKQFKHLEQFKPSMIKPFLSDVAHVYTDLLPKLMDSESEESWLENLEGSLNESVLSLYFRGKSWRDSMQPIFSGKQSGYDERLQSSASLSDAETDEHRGSESASTTQESQCSDDLDSLDKKYPLLEKPRFARERSNSDLNSLTDVDNWLDFDQDVRSLLEKAAESRGITVSRCADQVNKAIDFDFLDTASQETTLTESETNEGFVCIPSVDNDLLIKQNAYFKSIYLNMYIYYIEGRLLLIKEDLSKNLIFNHTDITERLRIDLKNTYEELETHNQYMDSEKIRNPFHCDAYKHKGKTNKLAKIIASELLRDAENYLSKHFKKDKVLLSRYGDSYKCIYAIKYSVEYMIKNFAVIGMYSIFHQFDMYHYPRRTTEALITFTNKFLNPIIKTLINTDPQMPHSPMEHRDTSNVLIAPYITTPIEIKEEFLADVSKTIRFIKEEWERGGTPEDMYQALKSFEAEELSQISGVLLYWIDFGMADFKKLSRRSILHLKEGGQDLQHDPQFEEALKNAKIVMKMLISCMRYSLPEEDYRFTKMISLYKKALRVFTLVLKALNCDFSTDKLDVIVDVAVIDRMRAFLGKIEDEKLALSDAYQILGDEYKEMQISELDQKINDTRFLINNFGYCENPHNPYESEEDGGESGITDKERSCSIETDAPSSDVLPSLLVDNNSMFSPVNREGELTSPTNADNINGNTASNEVELTPSDNAETKAGQSI